MAALRTNEKQLTGNSIKPCPHLPPALGTMSYRNLRLHSQGPGGSAQNFFQEACRYANYLWLRKLPARAILALCRAIYVDPQTLNRETRQPYAAYVWMLRHAPDDTFLGNPRFSFARQATRVPENERLKSRRAWALWYLTCQIRPELPADPNVPEHPPGKHDLAAFLNDRGLPGEGTDFLACLAEA
jgi:hypothetical protein